MHVCSILINNIIIIKQLYKNKNKQKNCSKVFVMNASQFHFSVRFKCTAQLIYSFNVS